MKNIHYKLIVLLCLLQINNLFAQNKTRKIGITPLPVIAYAPETKFAFGGLLILNFKLDKDSNARKSYTQTSFLYTQNKQYEFNHQYILLSPEEKYIVKGKIMAVHFPQQYYGYGNQNKLETSESIDYYRRQFDTYVYRKINKRFYVGLAEKFNNVYKLTYDTLGFMQPQVPGADDYSVLNAGPVLFYDSRNHTIYPDKGIYFEAYALMGLIGSYKYNVFQADFRYFKALSKNKKHILGYQCVVGFTTGNVPWKNMFELGGVNQLRSYYAGSYRDYQWYMTQLEYRFPIYKIILGSTWLGFGETHGVSKFLSNPVYSAGLGLRIMINKKDKNNIRIDAGFGKNSNTQYLDILEGF